MTASAGRRRHVLIIVENLPVPFDRRVWQEACALRDAGYAVSVICPKNKDFPEKHQSIEGIEIYRHPLPMEGRGALGYLMEYGAALFWEAVLAWRIFFKRRISAVHACNPPDLIFLAVLPLKLFGVRFVFDHHDICPELYQAKFGRKGLLYYVMRIAEYLTFKVADVSIATNDSYREIAIKRGGMDPRRVFVVRSGPDLKRVRPVPAVEKLKKGRQFLVGYVGVMGKQEGIDLLLRSVRHIVHGLNRRDIQFVLVGGGTELEAMKAYAAEVGVAEFVDFTGRVSDADLLSALSTADICVNPDVVNEMNDKSTMNKIMEYMALGKPIVQFDLKEGRVSAGDASLYANPNDEYDFAYKIVQLLADPERRRTMGEAGMQRVNGKLAWDYQVPSLLAAYSRLFGEESQRLEAGVLKQDP